MLGFSPINGSAISSLPNTTLATIGITLTVTEAADSVSSGATLSIAITSSVTEVADSTSSTVSLNIVADYSVTEVGDSVSSSAALTITASVTVTEIGDTVSSAGSLEIVATLSAIEVGDTVSSTAGTVGIVIDFDVTEAGDTVSSTATLSIIATVSAQEQADTISVTVTLSDDSEYTPSSLRTTNVRLEYRSKFPYEYEHSVGATLDYSLDWSTSLQSGETITDSTWTALTDGVTITRVQNVEGVVSSFLHADDIDTIFKIVNTITTSIGRVDSRTVILSCKRR